SFESITDTCQSVGQVCGVSEGEVDSLCIRQYIACSACVRANDSNIGSLSAERRAGSVAVLESQVWKRIALWIAVDGDRIVKANEDPDVTSPSKRACGLKQDGLIFSLDKLRHVPDFPRLNIHSVCWDNGKIISIVTPHVEFELRYQLVAGCDIELFVD